MIRISKEFEFRPLDQYNNGRDHDVQWGFKYRMPTHAELQGFKQYRGDKMQALKTVFKMLPDEFKQGAMAAVMAGDIETIQAGITEAMSNIDEPEKLLELTSLADNLSDNDIELAKLMEPYCSGIFNVMTDNNETITTFEQLRSVNDTMATIALYQCALEAISRADGKLYDDLKKNA